MVETKLVVYNKWYGVDKRQARHTYREGRMDLYYIMMEDAQRPMALFMISI